MHIVPVQKILILSLFVLASIFTVNEVYADHDQHINIIEPNGISDVCSPNNTDCTAFPILNNEQIVFELHSTGVYSPLDIIKVWIDKDNYNSNTEIFEEFGNEGGTSSQITVTKNGEGHYQIIIDTTNISDGTHNVKIDGIKQEVQKLREAQAKSDKKILETMKNNNLLSF